MGRRVVRQEKGGWGVLVALVEKTATQNIAIMVHLIAVLRFTHT